jgi:hypothetical protein
MGRNAAIRPSAGIATTRVTRTGSRSFHCCSEHDEVGSMLTYSLVPLSATT